MQAVDLEKIQQMKLQKKLEVRGNMYNIATNLMIQHSGLVICTDQPRLTKKDLVLLCLELAQEHFKQINETDKKLNAEEEKENGSNIIAAR